MKSSELFQAYIAKHGSIKKDRTIAKMMNNPNRSMSFGDIIKYVDGLYENYKN